MATLSAYVQGVSSHGNPGRKMYMVEKTVDLTVETTDPSAGDILQVLTVPAGTMILNAGLEVIETVTANTGTDVTVDLGTAVDDDEWVAAFDVDGASVGDYAPVAAAATAEMHGAEDTLDLTFAGTGASFTSGKVRVFALFMDVGLIGDKTADEVDRDQLA